MKLGRPQKWMANLELTKKIVEAFFLSYSWIIKPLGRKAQGSNIVEYGEPFTKDETVLKSEYIAKLKNSVVTERNKYNPNFVLDKVEDREEDEDTELSVEELRQSEQIELLSAIPNIENFKVEGKIDKTLITKALDIFEHEGDVVLKFPEAFLPKIEKMFDMLKKLF